MDAKFYTVAQVAERLATTSDKILAWIHSGELTAVNVTSKPDAKKPRWRISESAVARLLDGRQRYPTPRPVAVPTQARLRRLKAPPVKNYFPHETN